MGPVRDSGLNHRVNNITSSTASMVHRANVLDAITVSIEHSGLNSGPTFIRLLTTFSGTFSGR